MSDLGFSYREAKDGQVFIERDGRTVTVLRGDEAARFLRRARTLDGKGRAQLMARVTGNYKRGNERRSTDKK